MHRVVGVDGIDNMSASDYEPAKKYLQDLIDSQNESMAQTRLIARLMQLQGNKRHKAEEYCWLHFASKKFKDLNKEQLLQVIREMTSKVAVKCEFCIVAKRALADKDAVIRCVPTQAKWFMIDEIFIGALGVAYDVL